MTPNQGRGHGGNISGPARYWSAKNEQKKIDEPGEDVPYSWWLTQQWLQPAANNTAAAAVSNKTMSEVEGSLTIGKSLCPNRNAYPGRPDVPQGKRSSEEVAAKHKEKDRLAEEAPHRREQALINAAHVEDAMVHEDEQLAKTNGTDSSDLPARARRLRPQNGNQSKESTIIKKDKL